VRFIRLLDRTKAAGVDPEPLLREALGLWRGTPFGDEPLSDWLAEEVSRRLTERWLAAVQERIDLDLAAGRDDGLVEELEQLTAAYPLREPLWACYLVALDGAGRPADALVAYERIRVRLVDELGIDPSPELRGLYAALLRGDRPLVASAAPVAAPVPRQLPADLTWFTGREEAVAELDRALDQTTGIVVVHGLGGMGKTTLAVHCAHRIADRFPDGQLFVNLRGYAPGDPMEPAAALDLLLLGLGVPGDRIPAEVDARGGLWRTTAAGKRLLILVDNVRDADQVRPLLPGTDSLVLVTSRTSLRGLAAREGARSIHLHALTEADALTLLRARLGGVATDGEALVQLAGLCGNLPLALTVAAERVRRDPSLALRDLVAELRDERDRLDAFADPDDALSDVRAVLSWSYGAVGRDAARLLSLLGLAPSVDISLDAAAALIGESRAVTRRLLDRLNDASLVTVSRTGRYELHDLVRAYAGERARDQLSDDERTQALDRIFQWALATTTNAALVLAPHMSVLHPVVDVPGDRAVDFGDDEARAAAWLDLETDFLISVAYAAASSHPWVVVGIVHAIWDEVRWKRAWDGAFALQELARGAAQALGSALAEARALNCHGLARISAGEAEDAVGYLEQALTLVERLDDVPWQSRVVNNLGFAMSVAGRPRQALEYCRRALALKQRLGSPREEANVRNNMAFVLADLSMHDEAVTEAEQALALYRRASSVVDQAKALDTLGSMLQARGDSNAAIECFVEALDLGHDQLIPRPQALILANLARSQRAVGRYAEARFTLQSAISLIDEHSVSDNRDLRRQDLVELLAMATDRAQGRAAGRAR